MSSLNRAEQDKLMRWIEEIQAIGRGLTKWEEQFVDDMSIQLEEKGWMSERQAEIIERIRSEKTPN